MIDNYDSSPHPRTVGKEVLILLKSCIIFLLFTKQFPKIKSMQCIEATPAPTQQPKPIEQTKEPQFKHKLHWILGAHSTTEAEYNRQGFWPKEVVVQVEQIRPHQILTDSLSGTLAQTNIKESTPLTHPGNSFPDRENLYLVGADFDIRLINRWGSSTWEVTPIWKQILEKDDYFKALINHPNAGRSELFQSALINAYLIEGGILLPALTILSTTGISAIESKAQHKPFSLTRRMFLKIAASGALTVAAEFARWQASQSLLSSMAVNTKPDRNQFFAQAMKLVKPQIFQSTYLDLRNIKLGLTAYANARRLQTTTPVKGDFVSAIVFGRGHSLAIDPTSKEEVLLSKLHNHLTILHKNLPTLLAFGDDVYEIKQQLKALFSEYIVYEIPQNQKSKDLEYQLTHHRNEKVDQMIDEIFPEK